MSRSLAAPWYLPPDDPHRGGRRQESAASHEEPPFAIALAGSRARSATAEPASVSKAAVASELAEVLGHRSSIIG